MRIAFLAMFFVVGAPLSLNAKVCDDWKTVTQVHRLDPVRMTEVSGLLQSSKDKNLFYHVQDSGAPPAILISDVHGQLRSVPLSGVSFVDAEDLSMTNCLSERCVVVADTGDNGLNRSHVQFIFVPESSLEKSNPIKPLWIFRAKYPQGPQNTEALAFHPNGDLYLFTKKADQVSLTTSVFRLPRTALTPENTSKPLLLEFVSELDFKSSYGTGQEPKQKKKNSITSADIASTGDKVLLLTYHFAFEVELDLSTIHKKKLTVPYTPVFLPVQPQQEAIAYSRHGQGFYVTSEQGNKNRRVMSTKAALLFVQCTS